MNVGCIPSKALLESSENYELATHHFDAHGINITGASFDLAKMLARKNGIVTKMTRGIEFLFRKNKVTWLKGHGSLAVKSANGWELDVAGEKISAKHVVIATGSKARHLPGIAIDQQKVCDNVGAGST